MRSRPGWQVPVAAGAFGFLTVIDVFDRPHRASTKLERVAQGSAAHVDFVAHKSLNYLTLALHLPQHARPLAFGIDNHFRETHEIRYRALEKKGCHRGTGLTALGRACQSRFGDRERSGYIKHPQQTPLFRFRNLSVTCSAEEFGTN